MRNCSIIGIRKGKSEFIEAKDIEKYASIKTAVKSGEDT